uniref:Uncharacterized protein n=1 Tax=Chromera velia CCMP2878 TaxID=1169474 RepID=A0A0G4HVE6_9ALVE|eukprot:Cvel_8812.t1-p1 / transcript=Cvel_8812.t1 / gene=Cvel_8812 / organism=Chromera_velia_CCMP2878 / gene_product=Serine/arginine repetitive matrix protein 1, putative / transcript_product=Serine/arginine repetitive matrix protein 1, putative / location=Cvel_scaffold493:71660-78633(-) / protein_length=1146 / sequence_SO=supercontig / SO=protein_coding / is_pseudo=false
MESSSLWHAPSETWQGLRWIFSIALQGGSVEQQRQAAEQFSQFQLRADAPILLAAVLADASGVQGPLLPSPPPSSLETANVPASVDGAGTSRWTWDASERQLAGLLLKNLLQNLLRGRSHTQQALVGCEGTPEGETLGMIAQMGVMTLNDGVREVRLSAASVLAELLCLPHPGLSGSSLHPRLASALEQLHAAATGTESVPVMSAAQEAFVRAAGNGATAVEAGGQAGSPFCSSQGRGTLYGAAVPFFLGLCEGGGGGGSVWTLRRRVRLEFLRLAAEGGGLQGSSGLDAFWAALLKVMGDSQADEGVVLEACRGIVFFAERDLERVCSQAGFLSPLFLQLLRLPLHEPAPVSQGGHLPREVPSRSRVMIRLETMDFFLRLVGAAGEDNRAREATEGICRELLEALMENLEASLEGETGDEFAMENEREGAAPRHHLVLGRRPTDGTSLGEEAEDEEGSLFEGLLTEGAAAGGGLGSASASLLSELVFLCGPRLLPLILPLLESRLNLPRGVQNRVGREDAKRVAALQALGVLVHSLPPESSGDPGVTEMLRSLVPVLTEVVCSSIDSAQGARTTAAAVIALSSFAAPLSASGVSLECLSNPIVSALQSASPLLRRAALSGLVRVLSESEPPSAALPAASGMGVRVVEALRLVVGDARSEETFCRACEGLSAVGLAFTERELGADEESAFVNVSGVLLQRWGAIRGASRGGSRGDGELESVAVSVLEACSAVLRVCVSRPSALSSSFPASLLVKGFRETAVAEVLDSWKAFQRAGGQEPVVSVAAVGAALDLISELLELISDPGEAVAVVAVPVREVLGDSSGGVMNGHAEVPLMSSGDSVSILTLAFRLLSVLPSGAVGSLFACVGECVRGGGVEAVGAKIVELSEFAEAAARMAKQGSDLVKGNAFWAASEVISAVWDRLSGMADGGSRKQALRGPEGWLCASFAVEIASVASNVLVASGRRQQALGSFSGGGSLGGSGVENANQNEALALGRVLPLVSLRVSCHEEDPAFQVGPGDLTGEKLSDAFVSVVSALPWWARVISQCPADAERLAAARGVVVFLEFLGEQQADVGGPTEAFSLRVRLKGLLSPADCEAVASVLDSCVAGEDRPETGGVATGGLGASNGGGDATARGALRGLSWLTGS